MTEISVLLSQITAIDITILVLLGITNLFIFLRKKPKEDNNNEELQKQLEEQIKKVQELEGRIGKMTRPRHGLVARWELAKEEESACILNIYNDGGQKVFNLDLEIPEEYKKYCTVSIPNNKIDADSEAKVYLLPSRQEFTKVWLAQKFQPITLKLKYTESPLRRNTHTLQIPFKVAHTSQHFRSWLKSAAEKGEL